MIVACHWKRLSPTGPAEHDDGGSCPRSFNSYGCMQCSWDIDRIGELRGEDQNGVDRHQRKRQARMQSDANLVDSLQSHCERLLVISSRAQEGRVIIPIEWTKLKRAY